VPEPAKRGRQAPKLLEVTAINKALLLRLYLRRRVLGGFVSNYQGHKVKGIRNESETIKQNYYSFFISKTARRSITQPPHRF
jgi:hypothetical protein